MQIFLSYASEQRDKAEPIAFALRARGHEVFFDRDDLPGGNEYNQRIETAIQQSDLMVFLISPESVAPGRFTLTELGLAQRHWRQPSRRLLPVIVVPTDMPKVPTFAKSVTILEPRGNVAAEVASEVDRLRGLEYALSVAAVLGLVGLVSGLLSYFSYDDQGRALRAISVPYLERIPAPEIGFLFGLPIACGAWMWGQRRWWGFVIPFVILATCYWVTVPYISQYTYQVGRGGPGDPYLQLAQFGAIVDKIRAAGALNDLEEQLLEKVRSGAIEFDLKVQRSIVAWLIGLVLSGGTMLSLALILPAFRSVFRWLVVGAVGAAVSSLVTLVVLAGGREFSNWKAVLLMTLWLVVFSALVGYWLARGKTSVAG